jgi:hypothetical protein
MPWAPDYVTADELAAYIRTPDHVDDTQLALMASAASRAVDKATNRQFGQVNSAELRSYYARPDFDRGHGLWVVDVDDFMDLTGMVVTVDGVTVSTFDKAPLNAAPKGEPWTRIEFTDASQTQPSVWPNRVDATIKWGWSAIPTTVKAATLLQGSRFFARRSAPFGVAGSPDSGSEMRLMAKADPDVFVMLADYRRMGPIG